MKARKIYEKLLIENHKIPLSATLKILALVGVGLMLDVSYKNKSFNSPHINVHFPIFH